MNRMQMMTVTQSDTKGKPFTFPKSQKSFKSLMKYESSSSLLALLKRCYFWCSLTGMFGMTEKPLIGWKIRCLGACSSAFCWQFAGASFENVWTFCNREHRTARIILDFCPDWTFTCRRECGLSNSKTVSTVSPVLSLFSSVIPYDSLLFLLSVGVMFIRLTQINKKKKMCVNIPRSKTGAHKQRWLKTVSRTFQDVDCDGS